jgi:predicted CXXCH cytochrome family protein
MKTQADADRDLAALDERIALLKKQIDAPSLRADSKKLYQERLADLIQRRERLAAAPLPASEGKNTLAARFVPLEAAMPGSPETLALVQAYDREVAKLNLAWAKEHGEDCPKPGKNEAGYVGNEACRDCHAEAFPVWDASKHAHAYDDLAKAGKNYRLDCVKCHVVGYQQPGGVCRVDKVEARKDVGCESCHGPGSLHSADPTLDNVVRKPEAELCTGCHDLENSPHFDFALYLPEILGPGHGKPAPDGGTSAPPKRKR